MLVIVALIHVIVAHTFLHTLTKGGRRNLVCTVHKADIAATKDITVTVSHTSQRANLTTVDMNLGLTEDETIGMQRAVTIKVVVASTAAKDVTVDMTVKHIHKCFTWTVNTF